MVEGIFAKKNRKKSGKNLKEIRFCHSVTYFVVTVQRHNTATKICFTNDKIVHIYLNRTAGKTPACPGHYTISFLISLLGSNWTSFESFSVRRLFVRRINWYRTELYRSNLTNLCLPITVCSMKYVARSTLPVHTKIQQIIRPFKRF